MLSCAGPLGVDERWLVSVRSNEAGTLCGPQLSVHASGVHIQAHVWLRYLAANLYQAYPTPDRHLSTLMPSCGRASQAGC